MKKILLLVLSKIWLSNTPNSPRSLLTSEPLGVQETWTPVTQRTCWATTSTAVPWRTSSVTRPCPRPSPWGCTPSGAPASPSSSANSRVSHEIRSPELWDWGEATWGGVRWGNLGWCEVMWGGFTRGGVRWGDSGEWPGVVRGEVTWDGVTWGGVRWSGGLDLGWC